MNNEESELPLYIMIAAGIAILGIIGFLLGVAVFQGACI